MAGQRPCIICDRNMSTVPKSSFEDSRVAEAKLAHFFQLLGRYLDDDGFGGDEEGASQTWRVPFERILRADKIFACGDCSKIVKSFCELYQQLKSIELQLSCKVSTLKSLIRPQGVTTMRDDVIDFRKSLIAQCDKKLKSSFPKLEIRKCHSVKSPEVFPPLTVKEEEIEPSDNLCGHGNDEVEFGDYMETTVKYENINFEDGEGRVHVRKQSIHASALRIPSIPEIRGQVATDPLKVDPGEEELMMMEEYPWAKHELGPPDYYQPGPNEGEDDESNPVIPPIIMQLSDTPAGMLEPQSSINPETGSLRCDLCQKEFRDNANLKQHHNSFHLKIRYQCTLCPKQYYQPQHYDQHYRSTHMRGQLIPCPLCPKMFVSNSELTRHHQKVHLKVPPVLRFECPYCSMKFAYSSNCSRHKKICPAFNPNPNPKYECEVCHEKFQSVRARTEHQDEDHGGKKYACDYCGESFAIRAYKYVHKRDCSMKST